MNYGCFILLSMRIYDIRRE